MQTRNIVICCVEIEYLLNLQILNCLIIGISVIGKIQTYVDIHNHNMYQFTCVVLVCGGISRLQCTILIDMDRIALMLLRWVNGLKPGWRR